MFGIKKYVLMMVSVAACGGIGNEEDKGLFEEVPDQVTYQDHIAPIMGAYCDQCHFELFGGSSDFFSTKYEDEDERIDGVYEGRDRIRRRIILFEPTPMPPPTYANLGSVDREIFLKWLEQGAPND